MYINDSEKAFKMAKNSEKKFSFTLNNKIPGLKLLKYQDDNLFRLFLIMMVNIQYISMWILLNI